VALGFLLASAAGGFTYVGVLVLLVLDVRLRVGEDLRSWLEDLRLCCDYVLYLAFGGLTFGLFLALESVGDQHFY